MRLGVLGAPLAFDDWSRSGCGGHGRCYAVDSSKLREELGWRPAHTDFEEGLREAIAWYRDNEAWWADAKREAEEMYRKAGMA